MMTPDLFETVHLFANLVMVGVIWIVQLVHYPSFRYVSEGAFKNFMRSHKRRITIFVAPVMLAELFSLLWINYQSGFSESKFIFALILLGAIWLTTFLISIPCHNQLSGGKSGPIISKLINTNWIRTGAWTLKALLVVFM